MANKFTRFLRDTVSAPSRLKALHEHSQANFQQIDRLVREQTDEIRRDHAQRFGQLGSKLEAVSIIDRLVREQTDEIRRDHAQRFGQLESKLEAVSIQAQTMKADMERLESRLPSRFGVHHSLPQQFVRPAEQYLASNPELDLMAYLYPILPTRNIIDIGANTGDVSEYLLDTGCTVYAFEPFPPVFEKLCHRIGSLAHFHPFPLAIGSEDTTMELNIATDPYDGKYGDTTLYSTLLPRDISGDLVFSEKMSVPVRSLESLHRSGELPDDVSMVKIDTEGFDMEVIRGMGDRLYPVVCAEFWAKDFTFGKAGSLNHLEDMVSVMRSKGYHWNLIISRVEGYEGIACYMNTMRIPAKTWGNVFFFREAALFREAAQWHADRF